MRIKSPLGSLISCDENSQSLLKQRMLSLANNVVEDILGVTEIKKIYDRMPTNRGPYEFLSNTLKAFNIDHHIHQEDLKAIPATGPTIVVSNHPFGGIDGVLLAAVLCSVRQDVRILANYFLGNITDLRPLLILADPFERQSSIKANKLALRQCVRWLRDGGMLVVFPAGEVSQLRLKRRKIEDPAWKTTVSRLVRLTKAQVMPVYFDGHNSITFQLAGLIHPRLRTVLLPREQLKKRNSRIQMRLGSPIPHKRLARIDKDRDLTAYLRFRTYLLGNAFSKTGGFLNTPEIKQRRQRRLQPVVAPQSPELMTNEIRNLPEDRLLAGNGTFAVYLADAQMIPRTLKEIGRQREITFRQADEGTGKAVDLDQFDEHCRHLLVWDRLKKQIVGAYRMGLTDEIIQKYGREGLYTYTLFRYQNRLLHQLGPAMELSRSFVCREYQKNYAPLMLLWKGIGKFVATHPRYKILFGAVSITNDYKFYSRRLMAAFLKANNSLSDLSRMAKPRKPYRHWPIRDLKQHKTAQWPNDIEELSAWVSGIETDGKGVPILIKQYLKLGGKLLSFNIDSSFGNVLDGLIMVDLTRTDPKILRRYMGPEGFTAFENYHFDSYRELPVSGELPANA